MDQSKPKRGTITHVDATERRIAVLYISHDLISVHSLCDRVAIMDEGTIVESGRSTDLFDAPQHPVTEALTRSARNLLAGRSLR